MNDGAVGYPPPQLNRRMSKQSISSDLGYQLQLGSESNAYPHLSVQIPPSDDYSGRYAYKSATPKSHLPPLSTAYSRPDDYVVHPQSSQSTRRYRSQSTPFTPHGSFYTPGSTRSAHSSHPSLFAQSPNDQMGLYPHSRVEYHGTTPVPRADPSIRNDPGCLYNPPFDEAPSGLTVPASADPYGLQLGGVESARGMAPSQLLPRSDAYHDTPQQLLPRSDAYHDTAQQLLPRSDAYHDTTPQQLLPRSDAYHDTPQQLLPRSDAYHDTAQQLLPRSDAYHDTAPIRLSYNETTLYPPQLDSNLYRTPSLHSLDARSDIPLASLRTRYTVNTSFAEPRRPDRVDDPHEFAVRTNHSSDRQLVDVVSPSPNHFRSLGSTPHACAKPRDDYTAQSFASFNSMSESPRSLRSATPSNAEGRFKSLFPSETTVSFLTLPLWGIREYQELSQKGLLRITQRVNPNRTLSAEEKELDLRMLRGIELKREGFPRRARIVFLDLASEQPLFIPVWIEFYRMEIECGEYLSAHLILKSALAYHPKNELLLQKLIRVDEKLMDVASLMYTVEELVQMDTQKSLRTAMEGVASLARLGYRQFAASVYERVISNPRFSLGNFFLEFMNFEKHCGWYYELLRLSQTALQRYFKYGPLWFYCFTLIEHYYTLMWRRDVVANRVDCRVYDEYMKKAVGCLTNDILWRVFFVQIQFCNRAVLHVRDVVSQRVCVPGTPEL